MARQAPSEQEILGWFQKYSNWGRWGADDQLGTINFITPEKRKQAAGLVKEGVSVSCGRLIEPGIAADTLGGSSFRLMTGTGESHALKGSGVGRSGDVLILNYHGFTMTHMDSLAHQMWDGKMYNGHPAEAVTSSEGATMESIDLLKDGIMTRGVLLDVARTKGVKWLERGQGVFPEDLEETERAQGVRVESGDVILLRMGDLRRRSEEGPVNLWTEGYPGYHVASIPWLHERQVAILSSDGSNDVRPSGYSDTFPFPVHEIAHVALGLWLLDNTNLEELTAACERYGRWEFMFAVAPLRTKGGTGCPVNPFAVF